MANYNLILFLTTKYFALHATEQWVLLQSGLQAFLLSPNAKSMVKMFIHN
jgi:hypothetical protein